MKSFLGRAAFGVTCLLHATGCLSGNYSIRRGELERLAALPPDARGAELRARQRLTLSGDPEPVRRTAEEVEKVANTVTTAAVAVKDAAETVAEVNAELHVMSATSPSATASADSSTSTSTSTPPENHANRDDDGVGALAVAAFVVGVAFVGVALAASEGSRWDGTVSVSPEQPVHLLGAGAELGWVKLRDLKPSMLVGVKKAVISENDGAIEQRSRAPLDRVGIFYNVEAGALGMNTLDRAGNAASVGLGGRMSVGWFASQIVGIAIGGQLQTGSKGDQNTAIEGRPFAEVRFLPVHFGGAHLGLGAEGGYQFGAQRLVSGESISTSTWTYGGSLLGEVELTTRMSVTMRAGAMMLPAPVSLTVAPQGTVGLALY